MLPSCACPWGGHTEPQTEIAADSWSSHWDSGTQGSLGVSPGGTAGSQHPSCSCLQGSCNGRTAAFPGADTAQAWSHPAHAAQAESCTSCSSSIPPGCRISPGTHPNHSSQGSLDQARWGQARGGHISCGWFFLNHMSIQHRGAATGHAMPHPTRSTKEGQCRVKAMACKTRWVLWVLHLRASDIMD